MTGKKSHENKILSAPYNLDYRMNMGIYRPIFMQLKIALSLAVKC